MSQAVMCEAWTSYDDVGGEGEQTFYHECGEDAEHDGKHKCFGHLDRFNGDEDGWVGCSIEWEGRTR